MRKRRQFESKFFSSRVFFLSLSTNLDQQQILHAQHTLDSSWKNRSSSDHHRLHRYLLLNWRLDSLTSSPIYTHSLLRKHDNLLVVIPSSSSLNSNCHCLPSHVVPCLGWVVREKDVVQYSHDATNWRWREKLYTFIAFSHLHIFDYAISSFLTDSGGQNITRFFVPTTARIGDSVLLICEYSLSRGQKIYTHKWYKEEKEFWRHEPRQRPAYTYFNVSGINVDVSGLDISLSQHQEIAWSLRQFSTDRFTLDLSPTLLTVKWLQWKFRQPNRSGGRFASDSLLWQLWMSSQGTVHDTWVRGDMFSFSFYSIFSCLLLCGVIVSGNLLDVSFSISRSYQCNTLHFSQFPLSFTTDVDFFAVIPTPFIYPEQQLREDTQRDIYNITRM